MKLLLIDGNSILNRAFYGIKTLTTKDGHYTNAIYGFMNILLRQLEANKPELVCGRNVLYNVNIIIRRSFSHA